MLSEVNESIIPDAVSDFRKAQEISFEAFIKTRNINDKKGGKCSAKTKLVSIEQCEAMVII